MLNRLRQWFQRAGTGDRGERLAASWLRRELGYRIVARNWRGPRDRRDELDLVARDGEVLVFVEVKTRAADALVTGRHAVDERKRKVLRRAIRAYLRGLRTRPATVRFDIVEVALGGGPGARGAGPAVRHFANVPLFSRPGQP